MRDFKINKYITIKLENGKTNIYVTDKLFRQCKYLLLEIPKSEMSDFDEIESIDEAAERLDHIMENEFSAEIPPEVEFWAHSSNLQAWFENNYDTCILHSNLAFPLLKRFRPGKSKFADVILQLLNSLGIDEFYVVDAHAPTIINECLCKAINIDSMKLLADYIKSKGASSCKFPHIL